MVRCMWPDEKGGGMRMLKTLRGILIAKMSYEWEKNLIFAAENRVCCGKNTTII